LLKVKPDEFGEFLRQSKIIEKILPLIDGRKHVKAISECSEIKLDLVLMAI